MYRKNKLPHSSEHNEGLRSAMEVLAVIAGIVLLAALSWEIIGGSGTRFSAFYLNVQLAVCVVFLLDFFVLWSAAQRKMRYLGRNLLFLLISIPWLNILGWCGVSVTRDWGVAWGCCRCCGPFWPWSSSCGGSPATTRCGACSSPTSSRS